MIKQNNKIEEIMNSAIERIKNIIDTNTVVGEQIKTPKGFVIPLTKVSIGFVAGGGEYSSDDKQIKTTNAYPFAGGTGSGVCVQPIGFLSVEDGKINLIKLFADFLSVFIIGITFFNSNSGIFIKSNLLKTSCIRYK